MIREVTTREDLVAVVEARRGYLYNAFGGRDPKMCPIHQVSCPWVRTMLNVEGGRLGVPKFWSDSLADLVAAIQRQARVFSFCGSERAVLETAAGGGATPDAARPAALPAPGAVSTARKGASEVQPGDARLFHVTHAEGGASIQAWSSYRLQFNSTPRTVALKQAIAARLRAMRPRGGILEAVYTSSIRDFVDTENVLLDNVGTGEFAHLATEGLRFERLFCDPPTCESVLAEPPRHHHRYRQVAPDAASPYWKSGRSKWSARDIRIPRLDAFSKPAGVWASVRGAAATRTEAHEGRYELHLTLRTPPDEHVRPADIVKPLVDGVVAGLHVHDGSSREVVVSRVAAQLGTAEPQVDEHLHRAQGAVLGVRRLLWPRSTGVQWNPGDDVLVRCTLLHRAGNSTLGWELDADLVAVEPNLPSDSDG